MKRIYFSVPVLLSIWLLANPLSTSGEDWLQFKGDSRHSGNVPDRSVKPPLGLIGAVPLTDAVFTAPVVAGDHAYVVDGAGTAFCIDTQTLEITWTFQSPGGKANCNNVSSPAIVENYLHFGTMAGNYFVLDRETGAVIKKIECGEPIFSTPVVSNDRVYFSTLGSQIYALKSNGSLCWKWDFVKEHLGFTGNRWSGEDWLKHKVDALECVGAFASNGRVFYTANGGGLQLGWTATAKK